jgi:hypothetical protein
MHEDVYLVPLHAWFAGRKPTLAYRFKSRLQVCGRAVCTENSDSHVVVMKSAEDRHRCDATHVLDGPMDRSVFAKRSMSP